MFFLQVFQAEVFCFVRKKRKTAKNMSQKKKGFVTPHCPAMFSTLSEAAFTPKAESTAL